MTPEQIDELIDRLEPTHAGVVWLTQRNAYSREFAGDVVRTILQHAEILLKPKPDPCEVAFQAWLKTLKSDAACFHYKCDDTPGAWPETSLRPVFASIYDWRAAKERAT